MYLEDEIKPQPILFYHTPCFIIADSSVTKRWLRKYLDHRKHLNTQNYLLELFFCQSCFFLSKSFLKNLVWSLISNWTEDASFYVCIYSSALTSNLVWKMGLKKQFLSFLHYRGHIFCSLWCMLLQALRLKTLVEKEWEGLPLLDSKLLWIILWHFYTLGAWSWFYGQSALIWKCLGLNQGISFLLLPWSL